MEKMQNLLKLKEEEIEKQKSILYELKRKLIESNDKLSLKDMKISTLLQENQELKEKIKSVLENHSEDGDLTTSAESSSQISPDMNQFMETFLEKFEEINKTLNAQYLNLNNKIEKIEEEISSIRNNSLLAQKNTINSNKKITPKPHPQDINIPQGRKPSQISKMQVNSFPKPSETIKKKMIPPVVNIVKVNKNFSETPQIEPEIPKPSSAKPVSQGALEIPDEYLDTSVSSSPNKNVSQTPTKSTESTGKAKIGPESHSSLTMGQFGVPTIPYPDDGLIKCPKCGGNKIQEMENKKKIVMYNPRKYGKKYYCRECRAEWDYEY
ncbi:MAG: hypothetical protein ACTSWC_08305 [Promethearchaeota archaeon]